MTDTIFLKNILLWCCLAGAGLGLAGCGQKGDLYLPEKAEQTAPAPKTPVTQPGKPGAAGTPVPQAGSIEEEIIDEGSE